MHMMYYYQSISFDKNKKIEDVFWSNILGYDNYETKLQYCVRHSCLGGVIQKETPNKGLLILNKVGIMFFLLVPILLCYIIELRQEIG